MRVRRLDTERARDVRQFVTFPFQLYRRCPQWVPPLIAEAARALNRHEHPFYRHSTAEFFVAESGRRTLGRIAVMHNRRYNEYRSTDTAFFGFFDVVEDIEVARELFSSAFDWARAHGLDGIVGPRGLESTDASGVLVEGFEHRAALDVPYNYPYYDAFVTDAGLEKDTDYLSGYVGAEHELPDRLYRIAGRAMARRGFWIKSFSTRDELRLWVPRVAQVHRETSVGAHEFCPPTEQELELLAQNLIAIADPRLVRLVMQGEQVVGFVLAYHDISAGLQRARGRLWPFGWYFLQRERSRTRRANVSGIGLLPAYQGLGANTVLYVELAKSLRALGFEQAEVVQVDEASLPGRAGTEAIGVKWYKRHRSYKRGLPLPSCNNTWAP